MIMGQRLSGVLWKWEGGDTNQGIPVATRCGENVNERFFLQSLQKGPALLAH